MTLTSKQRAALRSIGNSVEPTCQIGKGEISALQIADLNAQLEKRELIKISVLKTNPLSAGEIAEKLRTVLRAETVAVTGFKILLYRRSDNEKTEHLIF